MLFYQSYIFLDYKSVNPEFKLTNKEEISDKKIKFFYENNLIPIICDSCLELKILEINPGKINN